LRWLLLRPWRRRWDVLGVLLVVLLQLRRVKLLLALQHQRLEGI